MPFPIPLAAALALSTIPQGPDVGPKAAAVAPFVGEEVAAVVHVDLARWGLPPGPRPILGKLAEDADLGEVVGHVEGRVAALKRAGATDLFLLIDPSDMPGYPAAVAIGGDPRAVAEALAGVGPGSPIRWPGSESIRGAVVAGRPEALARIRDLKPATRPELAAAMASAGDPAVRIALIPGLALRRAVEESFPTLPPEVGGGPIEALTRGMRWGSIGATTGPRPTLRVALGAKDPDAAGALRKVAEDALGLLARSLRSDPSTAELAEAVARIKPEATGDRVALEVDLDRAAALASAPIRRFREAARRSECVNNLKQIGLAMHNYHSTHKAFPAAYLAAADGKPLLSWRVLILPFLEQQELYSQFHLDEPWDGPHNKPLIARMPKFYACPGASKAIVAEGRTAYLAPRGPATMFPGAVGIKIQDITDGSSNTILVVDAGDDLAVTWTKPDDWEVAPRLQPRGLFGHHPRGTNFGLADGSVRFLGETTLPDLLRAMMTRDGGEILDDQP